jgi:ABC-type Na+ efflux pump permease subunit
MIKNNISTLMITNIKNNLRSKAFTLSLIFITLGLVAVIDVFGSIFILKPALEESPIDKSQIAEYLSLMLFATSILAMGISINVFTAQPLVKEKTQGIIESLLVTPLRATDIWFAKSFAVYLPGLIFSWIVTLISLIVINVALIMSEIGFLINIWMILSSFVGVPLIYLFLTLLVHLVGLTSNPISGNVIAQVFLPAYATIIINLGIRTELDTSSWFFFLINLIIAIVVGITVIVLKQNITKEKIILSGRS